MNAKKTKGHRTRSNTILAQLTDKSRCRLPFTHIKLAYWNRINWALSWMESCQSISSEWRFWVELLCALSATEDQTNKTQFTLKLLRDWQTAPCACSRAQHTIYQTLTREPLNFECASGCNSTLCLGWSRKTQGAPNGSFAHLLLSSYHTHTILQLLEWMKQWLKIHRNWSI